MAPGRPSISNVNRIILAILAAMAVLVVAVGIVVIIAVSGSDGGSDNNDNVEATDEGPTDEPDGDAPASGELNLAGDEPITLDPALVQDASSGVYVAEIYGGLLTLDLQLQLQPDLAAEIPSDQNGGKRTNGDGTTTYTFNLRDNAQFQDRKPVTADDVKYSLERAADPATQSLVAEFFLGDIVGLKEKLAGQAEEVSGVQVVDSDTIELTVTQDSPSFLFKLTYPVAYVVDQSQIEANPDNWTRQPNGTGPFHLDEWRLGEYITLKANPRYHLGAPKVDTVNFDLLGGGLTLYEEGEVDVTGVGVDDLGRVTDPADDLNAEYRNGSRLAMDYIGFNTNAPPFDDPNVRKAFAHAIDKDAIASQIFEDAIPVANSIMMPGLPAYNEAAQDPDFDPDLARQLLDDSEYGGADGLPEISIAESGAGATAGEATQAIVEMWRQNLGVDVTIEQAESATFFQDVDAGRYQMFSLGWIMDYPSEDNILNIHFDSESPNNNTGYNNAQVDQLLRQALTTVDQTQRNQLYQQAEQMILDDVPWFPLFFGEYHVLVKPYVQGYEIPPAIVPRLRFVSVER
jgi:ABC-type transport system substrate-binding protein